jgi:hypothetical protein
LLVRINKRIRTGGFPDDRKLHAGMTFFCACRKIEVANWISHRLLRRRNNSGAHAQKIPCPRDMPQFGGVFAEIHSLNR